MILAIESTCDETGAAVVVKEGDGVRVVSNVVASSAQMHEKYGGVVPEVAAREQVKVIIPVIKEALKEAGVEPSDLEAVAVSQGPGLIGSLLMGVETAKGLAYGFGKPLIAVNHLAAHVLANWITEGKRSVPRLPAVGLVVSGGHTDLIYMRSLQEWEWLGGTRDDAAGECLDKSARVLGLSQYLGGALIEKAAEGVVGGEFRLPRPLLQEKNLEMSFSGLKAALAREVEMRGKKLDEKTQKELAAELLAAVTEVLMKKTKRAVEELRPESVLLAGGVAASKRLRAEMEAMCQEMGVELFVPEIKYCTDNAAMIGAAAILRPEKANVLELRPEPGLEVV